MGGSFFECIDAGSENCPCYLSLTDDCMICTRLKGLGYCDCQWTGVCIYNEFIWNRREAKNPREDTEVKIVDKKIYKDQIVVFILETNKYLSQRFKYPGTYVFIRNPLDKEMYDVPISIMYVDTEKNHIHIAVKIISAKTKRIMDAESTLIIRGPYRNGILGLKNLKNAIGGNMLVLCKSMGIAPAVKMIKHYDENCKIDVIADINRLAFNFAESYLTDCRASLKYMNFKVSEDLDSIKAMIKEKSYDAVVIFASEKYIALFDELFKSIDYKTDYAVVNNFNMCCGEGVCGACSFMTEKGEVVKMCKCQMKGEEVLKRRPKYV